MIENNDVLKRIQTLLDEYGWTVYRLSKESGIPISSLSNMFSRNTQPSVSTLERICKGFGISIGDFFESPTTSRPDLYVLNYDERIVIDVYRELPNNHKDLLYAYLHGLAHLPVPERDSQEKNNKIVLEQMEKDGKET